eukprot:TRINITY_DN5881_c0_g1_i3.p1 TRINITY_DN5881_c0_g1~~TRINITY_DN5881_c0_g1_i3.p1  ORF type:complete len:259 (-),score=-60.46 TRINITY_DN5881_c0_g1_i3:191-967(-)
MGVAAVHFGAVHAELARNLRMNVKALVPKFTVRKVSTLNIFQPLPFLWGANTHTLRFLCMPANTCSALSSYELCALRFCLIRAAAQGQTLLWASCGGCCWFPCGCSRARPRLLLERASPLLSSLAYYWADSTCFSLSAPIYSSAFPRPRSHSSFPKAPDPLIYPQPFCLRLADHTIPSVIAAETCSFCLFLLSISFSKLEMNSFTSSTHYSLCATIHFLLGSCALPAFARRSCPCLPQFLLDAYSHYAAAKYEGRSSS